MVNNIFFASRKSNEPVHSAANSVNWLVRLTEETRLMKLGFNGHGSNILVAADIAKGKI